MNEKFKQLSPVKVALLAQLSQGKKSLKAQGIPRFPENDLLPLSLEQERLWFLSQLQQDSSFYNISGVVQVAGNLNREALQGSLYELLQRHEALRTTFYVLKGEPYQKVTLPASAPLLLVDLESLPDSDCQVEEAMRLAEAICSQSLDLEKGPLFQVVLICLSLSMNYLVVTMHHIISDGWSLRIFIQELATLYDVYEKGSQSSLPKLPIRYADYAIWQRQHLKGEVLNNLLAYWKNQLAGSPPVLELPSSGTRLGDGLFHGAAYSYDLPTPLVEKLEMLSSNARVTIFMTMLAAFQILLSRESGLTDIATGTFAANRSKREIEGIIGFFVNTLVIRSNLADNPTFLELLQRVCKATLDAYEHVEMPFGKLVKEMGSQGALGYNPLFQVAFSYDEDSLQKIQASNLVLKAIKINNQTAKFDLTLALVKAGQNLKATWEYNTSLFNPETISQFSEQFQILLEGIIQQPERRIAELPILTETERRLLLPENHAPHYKNHDLCIHQWFESQSERCPDAIAVTCENQQITYRELNTRGNQLAHYLQKYDVKAETLVAIFVERSLETVIGLLGILKAGGTYIPLDPKHPAERITFILKDAQPKVLLICRHVQCIPKFSGKVIYLDADKELIDQESVQNPINLAMPDNLAYIIFTSGSTGNPKGVAVTHRNVVRLFDATYEWYRFSDQDVWALFHSFAFDFSVWELWGALFYGARLVLVPYLISRDPETFYRLLFSERVTVLNQTPSAFYTLIKAEELLVGSKEGALRLVIFGGEALDMLSLLPWFQLHGDKHPQLVNMYGITETTVHSTYRPITMADLTSGSIIGIPIPDLHIYLLDQSFQLVPVGAIGEIYIGGTGVARGYYHQARLTGEHFIPDPFDPTPGARLYKSGDLARYLPDGDLEYIGRSDHQVKIRGFRVELGEIENALEQHSEVYKAVVIAQKAKPEGSQSMSTTGIRLSAFLVLDKKKKKLPDLRDFLKNKLPDYMLPATFTFLDELPLTNNGKVDRNALKAIVVDEAGNGDLPMPSTAIEGVLAAIWADILGQNPVGSHQNFFEIGGHSLQVIQVLSRIRDTFHVEISVYDMFTTPTIEGMAQLIASAIGQKSEFLIPSIQPVTRREYMPLSYPQQQLWLVHAIEPETYVYNIPIYIHLMGELSIPALQQSLAEIVRRHEILRTTFQTIHWQPFQYIHPSSFLNLPVIDLGELPFATQQYEVARLAKYCATSPFHFELGPLMRVLLIATKADEYFFLLTFHHIIFDGWSGEIFATEFVTLYNDFVKGSPLSLAEPTLQYVDYAVWQHEQLSSDVLKKLLAYWVKRLSDAPKLLTLPLDRPRTSTLQTFIGTVQTFLFQRDLTKSLKALSTKEESTLFMTLFATFNALMHFYSHQEDIIIGVPLANRTRSECERMIGMFVNTLPLRTDLSGDPTIQELLRRIRDAFLEATIYQELPFEKIVEELRVERNAGYSSVFQVVFTYNHLPVTTLQPTGLKMEFLESDRGGTTFDINVRMDETEDGINGSLSYNSDLFDELTIRKILMGYEFFLRSIVEQRDIRLSVLEEKLREEERNQSNIEAKELHQAGARKLHDLKQRINKHMGEEARQD